MQGVEEVMDPLHPTDTELEHALIPVVIGIILLVLSIYTGAWDKFLETAVEWFPIWNWGA